MLPRSVARVNSILMLHAEAPLTTAAVSRAAGLPYTPTASALDTLEKRGVVRRTRRLGQDEFEPNTDSPYYPIAEALALVDLPLSDALAGEHIVAVYAYGSLSHPGAATKNSDLDLLLVGAVKDRAALVDRLAGLGGRIGRTIDPFILTPEEVEVARTAGDPHVLSALGGVRVMGWA